ncbi:hypothetical protein [Gilvibacter sediminis]|uniref:hypothetical protein n=1 Tax=Gilvibacter sediminis TaxID=379071 RepID=UPI00234FC3CD|nr:hypothetical protein [Gilvibacter sediminis]MDC7998142.1 hypothetical protein [Gilvibacter sediminis]
MKTAIKFLTHLTIIAILTALTQVGGLLYGLVLLFYRPQQRKTIKRAAVFIIGYLVLNLWGIPQLASYFGRVELPQNEKIQAHNYGYRLLNRHYVTPELRAQLEELAAQMQQQEPDLVLVYLDANFPFIDGFPLFPHLSHNDGKKIDLSFVYRDEFGKLTNDKPSRSGYGVFESPKLGEFNQTEVCLNSGNKQYDKTAWLTLGVPNKDLAFDAKLNTRLLQNLSANGATHKIFVEPHLKHRLGIGSNKVRFQGCHAVRHDDHIHWQIK